VRPKNAIVTATRVNTVLVLTIMTILLL